MTKKLIIIPLAIAGLFWLYNTQIAVTPRGVIEDLDEAGMVVFSPHDVKSTITVFTDTSCGYCVKLHREIGQTIAGGVKVRYLGYPRAGVNSPSFKTLVSAWCADNA